ncbi:MAG: thiamine-phosphate kinase [Gammaproteobacteria bacterium]|nr:thiamine-phosphate kinase [Gammaproteobacteria bacterium]
MALTEFSIIERYFAQPAAMRDPDVVLGIGDDAALLHVPEGMELAVATDTLVEGVHFSPHTKPGDIGYKALAVNLSDMAAMGAEPRWATLALTLPQADESWLADFSAGFFALASEYRIQLIGGDTTRGPLSITVQILGLVPAGTALRRSGAHAGDLIYVTGTLGDAGLGLRVLQQPLELSAQHAAHVMQRLNRPQPRVTEGIALRGIASAAIDVSDGLGADLGHILQASGAGARINLSTLPLSAAVADYVNHSGDWCMPLCAGDDYELCFTVPAQKCSALLDAMKSSPTGCTHIGVIEAAPGLRCISASGELITPRAGGYQHFSSDE